MLQLIPIQYNYSSLLYSTHIIITYLTLCTIFDLYFSWIYYSAFWDCVFCKVQTWCCWTVSTLGAHFWWHERYVNLAHTLGFYGGFLFSWYSCFCRWIRTELVTSTMLFSMPLHSYSTWMWHLCNWISIEHAKLFNEVWNHTPILCVRSARSAA